MTRKPAPTSVARSTLQTYSQAQLHRHLVQTEPLYLCMKKILLDLGVAVDTVKGYRGRWSFRLDRQACSRRETLDRVVLPYWTCDECLFACEHAELRTAELLRLLIEEDCRASLATPRDVFRATYLAKRALIGIFE